MSNEEPRAGWLIAVRRAATPQTPAHEELWVVAEPDLAKALTRAEEALTFTSDEVPESVRSYTQEALDFWSIKPGQIAHVQILPRD